MNPNLTSLAATPQFFGQPALAVDLMETGPCATSRSVVHRQGAPLQVAVTVPDRDPMRVCEAHRFAGHTLCRQLEWALQPPG